MTLSIFQKIAFVFVGCAIGVNWKGWWEFSILLFLVSLAFTAPQKFWVALGVMTKDAWNYAAPRAHAVGGQAANHAGQVAHQASNGFRAAPWFWSGVVTGVLGIGFLLGAAWNENVGTLQVSGILFALSAIGFITYYDWWVPIGTGLLQVITFVKTKTVAVVSKYLVQVWLGISLLFFVIALYNNWSTGSKWLWGIYAVCATITLFKGWPRVGGLALEILKTSVGGSGFYKMILLNGAILGICGYYVSQNVDYNLGVLLTTGAIGFAVVAVGLKEFVEYAKK